MKDKPEYKNYFPIAVEVEEGKTYHWCGCGQSNTQPFCDKRPLCQKSLTFVASLNEEIYFCNCKQTKNPPWCDGSHGRLLMEAMKTQKSEPRA